MTQSAALVFRAKQQGRSGVLILGGGSPKNFILQTEPQIQEVLAYDDHTGLLDAIVWLGAYRADRAASAVRLLEFTWQGRHYRYLTNVLAPTQLSGWDIASRATTSRSRPACWVCTGA